MLFAILQKYDFSSKSQHYARHRGLHVCCLRYCKSTIFQANHNLIEVHRRWIRVVCDTAKVRFFKQITTNWPLPSNVFVVCDTAKVRFFKQITTFEFIWITFLVLFAILQKYDFSSKSQRKNKSTKAAKVVCDTAKVRFFKQITTPWLLHFKQMRLFAILQKYDFSSKSQPNTCLNGSNVVVCDTAKVRFFKQITTHRKMCKAHCRCLRYCKSTIFQANHNPILLMLEQIPVVCDTAKVRFFKQITTKVMHLKYSETLFAILQKYDFSSKSQLQKYLF